MRRAVATALLMLCAFSANAEILNFENGHVTIAAGDPVTKLTKYMGHPMQVTSRRICTDPQPGSHCQHWTDLQSWYYFHEGLSWEFKIYDGKIKEMRSSRF